MLDVESIVLRNVSYLHARDPSILAWNRTDLDEVRVNLAKELLNDNTVKSSEIDLKQENSVQVFLRIKKGVPFEKLYDVTGDNLICKVPEGSQVLRHIKEGETMTKTYSFTKIFGPEINQTEIFNNIVKVKILGFINGKNSSLLTYGASGSGKTFTIVGTPEEPGLIPRALEYIFRTIPQLQETPKVIPLPNGEVERLKERIYAEKLQCKSAFLNSTHAERAFHIKTYKLMQQRLSSEEPALIDDLLNVSVSMWVSFAEIYNENVYDLLTTAPVRGKTRPKLRLGNSKDACYIKDLTSVHVTSGIEAYQILQYGLHNLNYAATSVNTHSSRSHSIFSVKLIQLSEVEEGVYVSTFNFCDLAGSERVKKTMNVGDRLRESNNINTSLLVLGRCIHNIRSAQQLKDNRLIPFRESKLTQLLQRGLMGDEDIMMIVNMNSSRSMFDETQHVLNFSAVAKEILVEERHPKIAKPKRKNRFSQYMENKTNSAVERVELLEEEEDEKDIEINKLKVIVTDLYTELQHNKREFEVEQKLERDHIISTYKAFIAELTEKSERGKAVAVEKVRRECEQRIQALTSHYRKLLEDQEDVISIHSSSEDENESLEYAKDRTAIIKDLEKTVSEQNLEISDLKQEVCQLRVEKEKLEKDVRVMPKLMEQIKSKTESEIELRRTVSEAEEAYSDLQSELRIEQARVKELVSEKMQLAERLDYLEGSR